jgi:hypothetical protein
MKIKTSELTGAALDWAVAKCEGATNLRHDTVATWWFTLNGEDRALSRGWSTKQNFAPSTNWSQGGPIIEREEISTAKLEETLPDAMAPHPACWSGHIDGAFVRYGPTPLIAAMRCYCVSKLGDDINIPEELL